ncbi:MAG TPA: hypothetical protein VLI46_10545 [Ramlibacter sp.]|nr:hypothetical protein [Ramlibacter sp.]
MPADFHAAGLIGARSLRLAAAGAVLALCACAAPLPAPPPAPSPPPTHSLVVTASPAPAPASPPSAAPTDAMLAYAERIRNLQAAELAQEINGLGDPQDAPGRMVQLAIALGAARNAANNLRAQALLQRVIAQTHPPALALHPLARLLLAQQAESRRLEEQAERLSQQVRDGQRRIEQLNERLEALRAIERSLPQRPVLSAPSAAAPAGTQRR